MVSSLATFRNVPSAGARHALDTYVLVNRVAGVAAGLYRFVATRHAWLDPGADHVCLVLRPVLAEHGDADDWFRLADASAIEPGHEAEERQRPS